MKFIKRFTARMIIEAGIFWFLATLLLQMTFDMIEIDHEASVLPAFYILPLIFSLAVSGFAVFMEKHNTNLLRRYEFSLGEGHEYPFYIFFALLLTAACVGDMMFLAEKCRPFLESALSYSLKDAQIKNETPEMRQQIIDEIYRLHDSYSRVIDISAVICCVVQGLVFALNVPKLVKEYRDPPDYWSGRKKGEKVKR